MLRALVLVLFLANVLFYTWSQGGLSGWGLAPPSDAQPERLAQQLAPQSVVVLAPGKLDNTVAGAAAASVPATPELPSTDAPGLTASPTPDLAPVSGAAPEPARAEPATACFKVDGLSEEQVNNWTTRAKELGIKAAGWKLSPEPYSGRWLVYFGRFDNEQELEKKKRQLELRGLRYQELRSGPLALGLSLSTHPSEAAAKAAIDALRAKAVRSAFASPERPDQQRFGLRFNALSAEQRAALPGMGRRLQRC